jgi:hypothetical protein
MDTNIDPRPPAMRQMENRLIRTEKKQSLLEGYPHEWNPNNKTWVPNCLLDENCELDPTEKPFSELKSTPRGAAHPWDLTLVPRLAACGIKESCCSLVILDGPERERQWALTNLEKELPSVVGPAFGQSFKESEELRKKRRIALWGILPLAALTFLLWAQASEGSPLPLATVGVLIAALVIYATSLSWKMAAGSKHHTLRCRKPEIGPATKAKIRNVMNQGWEDIHLVWESEEMWQGDGSPLKPDAKYEDKELIVAGEKEGVFHVLARIADRNA